MASQKHETVFDLESLFRDINRSFTSAALDLHREFAKEEWQSHPFVYHMPKMHLSIQLEFSHSDGKVKGLFRKESKERREGISSTIEVDVVSAPRIATRAAGGDASG